MAAGKTLTVYLAADISKFSKNLGDAEFSIGSLASKYDKMLGPALLGAAAAAGAFATKLAVDGVQAAIQEQAELEKLNTTLGNLGFGAASAQVNTFIDDLQFASGVADSELRPAFDRLVRSTGNVDEAQRALKIALDASVGSGKGLQEISNALGKAYDGNTTALGKLGIGLDKATLASGNLELITSKMAATFEGQSARAADTLKGQMDRLKIAGDELIEAFGTGVVGALGDSKNSTDALVKSMRDAQGPVSALGAIAGKTASGGMTFLNDMLRGLTSTGGPLWLLGKALGINTAAMNDAADAANGLGQQFQYVQYSAYNAANGLARVQFTKDQIAGMHDSGIAALAAAERTRRLTEILGHAPGAYDQTETAARSYGKAAEDTNPKIEAQTTVIEGLIARLGDEKKALDDVVKARADYAAALSGNLLKSGAQLKDFLDPKDVAGSAQKFIDALQLDAKFAAQFGQVGQTLGTSDGARSLLDQISALGQESGTQFLNGLTPEIAGKIVSALDESIKASNASGYMLADTFYKEGVEGATQLINGTIVEIAASEKKLRKIGQNIGKPIGANIKAEIADAVAEAVKAAEAAKTAAAAERAAQTAAANVTVTEQQVAKALQQLIVNADKRSTGQVGVLQ